MGQCCPREGTSFSSKQQNTVPEWLYTLNSALATVETWDLKECNVNIDHLKDNSYSTYHVRQCLKTLFSPQSMRGEFGRTWKE